MNLLDFRTAIVAGLAANLGNAVRKVEAIAGRIDDGELRRMLTQAPSVYAAVLGVTAADQTPAGEYELTVSLGAFIVTASKPGVPRDAAGLTLVTAVLQIVPNNDWMLEQASRPTGVRADNLYSGVLDKKGLALWAVTWRQNVCVGGLDLAMLDDFITFHADWDVGQTDDTPEPADHLTGLDQ